MIRQIKDIINRRQLILTLAASDFKKRFIGSYLGVFWIFMQPIVSIVIYYFVFQIGFKSNPVENMPYVLWLMPGIIPWFFFNDTLQSGVSTLSSYKHLVKKMVFRIDILPLIKVVSSLFIHFIFIFILMLVFLIFGESPSVWWLQTIYYLVCNIMLVAGLVYLTSAINVFVKDTNQIVSIFLQFGFWIAPIMWDISRMPEEIHWILRLNPFTYIVDGFRDCFVYHVGFWTKPYMALYFWVFTLVIFIGGVKLFKKMEPHFADVL